MARWRKERTNVYGSDNVRRFSIIPIIKHEKSIVQGRCSKPILCAFLAEFEFPENGREVTVPNSKPSHSNCTVCCKAGRISKSCAKWQRSCYIHSLEVYHWTNSYGDFKSQSTLFSRKRKLWMKSVRVPEPAISQSIIDRTGTLDDNDCRSGRELLKVASDQLSLTSVVPGAAGAATRWHCGRAI